VRDLDEFQFSHFTKKDGSRSRRSRCKHCDAKEQKQRFRDKREQVLRRTIDDQPSAGNKFCTKCGVEKPLDEFNRRPTVKDGRQAHCKSCVKQWRKSDYDHREGVRERSNERTRECNARLRAEMISAYGSKCVCCGESRPQFLTVDHKDGSGARHRKQIGDGAGRLRQYLRANGYPKDNYQLLCFNCNCSKGFYGRCPHEDERLNNLTHI